MDGGRPLEPAFLATGGEMGRRIAAYDWAGSPIGPIDEWPSGLCTAVGIMLESRHPMLIWWGSEFTMFYNDAFALLAGSKHPAGLGRHGWEMFAEIWPTIGPMLERVLSHGDATWVDDQLLVMNRRGMAEETYWTYSYSPIRDSAGQVRGVFTATSDTTGRVLGERRLRTLSSLGDVSAVQATTVEQACVAAATVLACHRGDLPAGLVYLLSPEGKSARLAADYGFRPGSAIVVPSLPGSDTEDEPRSYDTADLTLAEELGRRAALMVQAERRQSRDHYLREITATLASAGSVAEVAQHLGSVAQILGATGLSVYLLDPEHGLRLAQAMERAAIADERLRIADTLQRSLLPQQLPELSRLGLAAHYQPGAAGTQAGGDWYDVIPLADARVAIVVGDVVGHGTPAAAVMGRLRNALAGYLLEGHPPATALEHLDHFASRVTGALGSSVACVVLNTDTGDLRWARAGHPPPLVIDREGARFLADARGTVLAVPGRTPFEEGSTRLDPGTSVLLYTDGLVERRGEIIDDSLARLSAGAASLATMAPTALLTALLERSLHQPGPADDVAVIVARLLPEPLHQRLPAHPDQLGALRRTIAVWAAAAGLSADTVSNLQLALGEATANAVEHAYANGTPGEFCVQVRCQPGGWMDVCVRDFGKWRPMPEIPGYRGRGLALIREVAADMTLDIHDDGTEVRFRLAVP